MFGSIPVSLFIPPFVSLLLLFSFRAAVSVFVGPCCSALLKLYGCKCAYCCIIGQINDDDDDDNDDNRIVS